jgi:hypothetical protein
MIDYFKYEELVQLCRCSSLILLSSIAKELAKVEESNDYYYAVACPLQMEWRISAYFLPSI